MPTLAYDELDVAPVDGEGPAQPEYGSSAEMLAAFEENAAAARAAIEGTDDEAFMNNWTMLVAGKPKFSFPKVGVIRAFIMDHLIHHRGQLTVYLRLLDVPVQQTFRSDG